MIDAATLVRLTDEALERKEEPTLELLRRLTTVSSKRLVWLLSVGLGLTEAEIGTLLPQIWPDESSAVAIDNSRLIASWPFVESTSESLRIAAGLEPLLAADFLKGDPEHFQIAHEVLAAHEESLEEADDEVEGWYSRGRIAYYLAGTNPDRSVGEFGNAFARPPILDRFSCRMWLTTLVDHQSYLLADHQRELAFFRGFRLYTSGRTRAALEQFEAVVADDVVDTYGAIARHLGGVILLGRNPPLGFAWIQLSLDMSRDLHIAENEVMARNTLIWALVRRAQEQVNDPGPDLDRARQLAVENSKVARATQDRSLIAWSTRSEAAVVWLSLTRMRTHSSGASTADRTRLLNLLHQSQELSWAIGDFETAGFAANDAASILRDSGELDRGLDELESFLFRLGDLRGPFSVLRNMAKTTGSIIRLSTISSTALRAAAVQEAIHAHDSAREPVRQASVDDELILG
jgi:hypothetical protein